MKCLAHFRLCLLAGTCLLLIGGCSQDVPTAPDSDQAGAPADKAQTIISFQNVFIGYVDQRPDEALQAAGAQIRRAYKHIPVVYAAIPAENIAQLATHPRIAFIEEEGYKEPGEQILDWGVDRIDAEYVHATTGNQGAGVNVAVLDSGGDMDHPDMTWAGGIRVSKGEPDDWEDWCGHGTHCAGIIGADDNDLGVIGVAPQCDIYAVGIFKNGIIWVSDMLAGIEWCMDTLDDADPDNDIQIMSMSWGGGVSLAEEMYFQAAYDAGMLLVACAMNDSGEVRFPAAYDCVMAISAVDKYDEFASFSNFGPEIELAAPGVRIYSTHKFGRYRYLSGTSMACPMVAGTAACIWSDDPSLTNDQVRARLKETAQWLPHLTADQQGAGLVDVEMAILGTRDGDDYVAPLDSQKDPESEFSSR
jgi:subtilisin/minor extracellular protease Epr